jgi:hypothetical protein
MKTILNIAIILLVAAVVAGGYALIVNNTSIASGPGGEGGQPPVMTSANGQTASGQMPARPEGGPDREGEGGASIGQGLLQVLVTLVKLAGITAIVLLIEKGFTQLGKRAPRSTPA